MKLSIDFSQDSDLEAIKAKALAFLKDAGDSGTVECVIHGAGEAASIRRRYPLDMAEAGVIAAYLAEYSKGKGGFLYNGATLEIRRSQHTRQPGLARAASARAF